MKIILLVNSQNDTSTRYRVDQYLPYFSKKLGLLEICCARKLKGKNFPFPINKKNRYSIPSKEAFRIV